MLTLLGVVGARPNYMKLAPLLRAARQGSQAGRPIHTVTVHTGQHYDDALSAQLFADLELAAPQHNLGVGSASHAQQIAAVMSRFEPVLREERPDAVLLVGDVNSTLACALTAATLGIPVAHVEAGLRSFERDMPEERNRVLTDQLSDFLFTTEASANDNLAREGLGQRHIHLVGNVMIDTLLACRALAERSTIVHRLGLDAAHGRPDYLLATVHRPANVDGAAVLEGILRALAELARRLPVVLPAHPRTRRCIEQFGLERYVAARSLDAPGPTHAAGRVTLLPALGYLDFLRLASGARAVLTDSGGVQEETTVLGIPCLTLRERTERPITVSHGTSELVGSDPERILSRARAVLEHGARRSALPPLWDGHAAQRIVDILAAAL